MKLSPDEESFLLRWIYDEAHYRAGVGPAKRLQVRWRAVPADLATPIAAGIPDLADQERAGSGPPPAEAPAWPWSDESLRARVSEAWAALSAASQEASSEADSRLGPARPSGG